MKQLTILLLLIIAFSCQQEKEHVDSIVINANVYTVNDAFNKAEAFAIKDGKFVEVGTSIAIKEKFLSDTIIDANGQTIVPGFIDAHCHFLGLGLDQLAVDLIGSESFPEVVKRVIRFQNKKNQDFILGNGWDQNDWDIKEFPDNKLLNKLFPETPIVLFRIDGHAILCNQAALDLGNVTINSKIEGGEVVIKDGQLTGSFS